MITLALTAALATPAAFAAEKSATRSQAQAELRHAGHVVQFFTTRSWMRAPRQENCKAVPWQRTCRIARRVYTHHVAKIVRLEKQLYRHLPTTNDWRTSVRLAQRIYPGTDDWLLFISAREGGYGPFVMNHQGSGAGGWMQFMASTFYAYVDDARRDTARRGFVVPPHVWTWTHPLGQALTAGYMRFVGKDSCHWCL